MKISSTFTLWTLPLLMTCAIQYAVAIPHHIIPLVTIKQPLMQQSSAWWTLHYHNLYHPEHFVINPQASTSQHLNAALASLMMTFDANQMASLPNATTKFPNPEPFLASKVLLPSSQSPKPHNNPHLDKRVANQDISDGLHEPDSADTGLDNRTGTLFVLLQPAPFLLPTDPNFASSPTN